MSSLRLCQSLFFWRILLNSFVEFDAYQNVFIFRVFRYGVVIIFLGKALVCKQGVDILERNVKKAENSLDGAVCTDSFFVEQINVRAFIV